MGEKSDKPVCECGSLKKRGYSNYYDKPDGCDVPTKIMVASRYGAIAGMVFGAYDVLMYSQAVGFTRMLTRFAVHVLPLAGMGATFALVSNAMLHYRQKDDRINYFLGGLACGPIFAYYVGSGHGVLLGGLLLGAIGYVKKTGVEEGWRFIPTIHPHMGLVNSYKHDYSWAHDPKGDELDLCEPETDFLP